MDRASINQRPAFSPILDFSVWLLVHVGVVAGPFDHHRRNGDEVSGLDASAFDAEGWTAWVTHLASQQEEMRKSLESRFLDERSAWPQQEVAHRDGAAYVTSTSQLVSTPPWAQDVKPWGFSHTEELQLSLWRADRQYRLVAGSRRSNCSQLADSLAASDWEVAPNRIALLAYPVLIRWNVLPRLAVVAAPVEEVGDKNQLADRVRALFSA